MQVSEEKLPLVSIQQNRTPEFSDLLALQCFAYNPWQIESNIFGTLGSSGEFGLEFPALCKVIFGVAEIFQHRGKLYDFGFGDGLVLFLAAAAGFESYGHELRTEGVEAAKKSLESDILKSLAPKVSAELGDCLSCRPEFYREIDVWYLYPSSGVTEKVLKLLLCF